MHVKKVYIETTIPSLYEDIAIKEIRDVRKKISEKFDNSPKKLVKHYMDLQKKHIERIPKLAEKYEKYRINIGE